MDNVTSELFAGAEVDNAQFLASDGFSRHGNQGTVGVHD
jgi:hypothetical protein